MNIKEIDGFPGYLASDDGRILSAWKMKGNGRGVAPTWFIASQPVRTLRAGPGTGGYLQVTLVREGKHSTQKVHLLVLESFAGKRPSADAEARHLNGDNTDNRASNLEWGTKAANHADRERHGTVARGAEHWKARLTAADIAAIRQTPKYRGFQRDMTDRYRISGVHLERIYSGETWTEVDPSVGVSAGFDERRKLTDSDIASIIAAPRGYGLTKALAKRYGVTVTRICQIRSSASKAVAA